MLLQYQQSGWPERNTRGKSWTGMSFHSHDLPSALRTAGGASCQAIAPMGRLQETHNFPAYQAVTSELTRQPSGEVAIWERQA
jgi:hypothetical protein